MKDENGKMHEKHEKRDTKNEKSLVVVTNCPVTMPPSQPSPAQHNPSSSPTPPLSLPRASEGREFSPSTQTTNKHGL